jgi:hypothetical protein
MPHQAKQRDSRVGPSKIHFAWASVLLMLACIDAHAASGCRPVNGNFTEQAFAQAACRPWAFA